ncbi:MAG: sugar ABC transporter substrate-binding protein [Christensenellaceae bacterium]|nr:sugar ABC transporter substrate-binding protein [Christensenellaceae bacterium]MEA5066349.1 sugar ABC transporter substrate-binding protein [Eubacteriales bacterium]MEA5067394.1 sugar ABC transporter substrate-binding protein [Christensenellaceae bacterium]
MKKFPALVLAVVLILGIGSVAMAEGKVFGYTCMTMNNPFFIVLEKAIREKVEAQGDELITVDPSMDVALQISQVEDLIVRGIDGIFLNPVDWEGITPALDELNKENIPIINFDTEVKAIDKVTAYVGSNNFNAGYVCGEDLAKRHPDGGNIVVLDSPTMNSVNDRISGFFKAIEESGVKFEVVHQADALGDLPTAMKIMDDVLQKDIEIVAIMGGNDPTALGAYAACKAAGRSEIEIYGVDGSPDAKAAIAEGGQFVGSGAQSPKTIGYDSVTVANKILAGESFEFRTPVKTFLITKDNVAEYGTDGWQ